MAFKDRVEAGRHLAARLEGYRGEDIVVLGLPRGGVPVAFEVAKALDAPLDVIMVRKLGVPFQPELAMGAIGEGDTLVLNERVLRLTGTTSAELAHIETQERIQLEKNAPRFRGHRPRVPLEGRTAIIVDDGIATGSTARAACRIARALGAIRVVLAVPVAAPGSRDDLREEADEVIAVLTPEKFSAVGQFYVDFGQTSDGVVVDLLERADRGHPGTDTLPAVDPSAVDRDAFVLAGQVVVAGHLVVPDEACGVVVFAHGCGSSRHSPRNLFVAKELNDVGFATLLLDLLLPAEELDRANVFDIELLASRLVGATTWLRTQPATRHLPIGYFGASTGAGAALWAAASPGNDVACIVSRGGRPDLAGPRLAAVRAPTLFIVGGDDEVVLGLNRAAQAKLRVESHLAVVSGAGHLFEEPGTLEQAAALACDWFLDHLTPVSQTA